MKKQGECDTTNEKFEKLKIEAGAPLFRAPWGYHLTSEITFGRDGRPQTEPLMIGKLIVENPPVEVKRGRGRPPKEAADYAVGHFDPVAQGQYAVHRNLADVPGTMSLLNFADIFGRLGTGYCIGFTEGALSGVRIREGAVWSLSGTSGRGVDPLAGIEYGESEADWLEEARRMKMLITLADRLKAFEDGFASRKDDDHRLHNELAAELRTSAASDGPLAGLLGDMPDQRRQMWFIALEMSRLDEEELAQRFASFPEAQRRAMIEATRKSLPAVEIAEQLLTIHINNRLAAHTQLVFAASPYRIEVRASSLLGAAYLHLCAELRGDVRAKRCVNCNLWFLDPDPKSKRQRCDFGTGRCWARHRVRK